uniref:hypothetical protein n=1 Tax=Ningiella ruwaisensis TaxID=2364274 RepID=UPI00109F6528|nr:hypothetical protein [Ningiella ruwaisensis]
MKNTKQDSVLASFGSACLAKVPAVAYFSVLFFTVLFYIYGLSAAANLNGKQETRFLEYGASVYKYPFLNRYLIVAPSESPLIKQGLHRGRLIAIDNCEAHLHASLASLYECANVGEAESLDILVLKKGQIQTFVGERSQLSERIEQVKIDLGRLALDGLFSLLSLALSLLLFCKARHCLSGLLLSFTLLFNVFESQFIYLGSNIISDTAIESIRITLAAIIGPLAMYYFPNMPVVRSFKSPWLWAIILGIVLVISFYHLGMSGSIASFAAFHYSVAFALALVLAHFIFKYKTAVNIRQRKQILTLTYCIGVGLVLYLPLMLIGGVYGFLVGRFIIPISIGLGVFFALMRYGLWQVESLISKSATLSVLSVVAFSVWAGIDQGLQALLNQTLGLSNKTFTAFLAAVISSLFAVPAYNFVSKSCDAFFNKNLHQLKRFLSKDLLVLAETQTLGTFIQHLGDKLLKLSGAYKIHLEFADHQRLAEPIEYESLGSAAIDEHPVLKTEQFSYEVKDVLSIVIKLTFADRRINKEIKEELEEGTDEMARALASCSRWNYLESKDPSMRAMRPMHLPS